MQTLYTALESRLVLETRLRFASRSGSLFELLVEVPAGFEVRLVAERLHSAMPVALELRAPRILNVARAYGVLAAAFSPAWEVVEPKYADGMASIPLRETPRWMRAAGAEVRLAARYWEGVAPEVEFGLRQAETRLSATVARHLSVLSDEGSRRVLVAYSIDGKAVLELSFTAPVDVRVCWPHSSA